jgi:hypothetical protein
MPGLKLLNRVRNDLAHDLESQISDKELGPFRGIVWAWHKASDRPCNKGIALVKDFALLASGLLSSHSNSIRRYGKGVGLVAYQRWLRNALRSERKE